MADIVPNLSKTLEQTESRITSELFSIFQQYELSRDQAEARTASVLSGVWNALEAKIRTIPRRRAA